MGATIRFDDRLLGRALAASIVLHLLFALFLPMWTSPESNGLQPIEAISFAHLMRVQIERPAVAALPSAIPKTTNVAPHITLARAQSELAAKTHRTKSVRATQSAVSDSERAAAPRHIAARAAAPLIAQAPASEAPAATAVTRSKSTPDPQTSDTRSVQSSGAADRGGVMPPGYFSVPVLDPGIIAQLSKLVTTHVTLTIVVGEDGKTKSVAFAPPLDNSTQDAIRQVLDSAAWDPAVCGGGVSCEGTAVIKL